MADEIQSRETPAPVPSGATVKMWRFAEEAEEGGPITADVAASEVENYKLGNWREGNGPTPEDIAAEADPTTPKRGRPRRSN